MTVELKSVLFLTVLVGFGCKTGQHSWHNIRFNYQKGSRDNAATAIKTLEYE